MNLVSIVMGSQSDWPVMEHSTKILQQLGIAYEVKVLSAHRAPDQLFEYVTPLKSQGVKVVIAAAGMAAHLAGVIAAKTSLPVLGVPMEGPHLQGMDALLSMVQMPKGIPVATFAIGKAGAINAALFGAAIIGQTDAQVDQALQQFRAAQTAQIVADQDVFNCRKKVETGQL